MASIHLKHISQNGFIFPNFRGEAPPAFLKKPVQLNRSITELTQHL